MSHTTYSVSNAARPSKIPTGTVVKGFSNKYLLVSTKQGQRSRTAP